MSREILSSHYGSLQSYHRICENRKRNIEDGRPDGGVRRKMQSDEIRCRTVPQIFSQMGYEWGITPVIERFTKILEPANPHKHWICKKIKKN